MGELSSPKRWLTVATVCAHPVRPLVKSEKMCYYATMQLFEVSSESTFQALGDATRLRIVRLLAASQEEACLCEFVDSLLEPQYKLSRHLKILRQAAILESEKDGRWVYHRLAPGPDHLRALVDAIKLLPDPRQVFDDDLKRFEVRLRRREGGRCRVGVLTESLKSEAA